MFLRRIRIPRQLRAIAWAARSPGGMVHKVTVWTHWASVRTSREISADTLARGDWSLERCSCGAVPDVVSGGGQNLMVRCPQCRLTGTMVGELGHIVSIWNAK